MNAIKHYGKENFIREIVDIADSEDDLNFKEFEWIKKYNAVNDDNFYNMVEGGKVQESLKRKNSIPIICIYNNYVFKSIIDAAIWSGYTTITIKKTFNKKHKLNNEYEKLIFRPLGHVRANSHLCCICGDNFKKRNNVHKKCDKCSIIKGKLIIQHDFKTSNETGIEISKLTDGWVKRKIDLYNKICESCGISFEKTKKYQRRCDNCLNKEIKKSNTQNKLIKHKEVVNV